MATKKGENLLYEDISYKVRGACFDVWREFGGAFKEAVIKNALIKKMTDLGLVVEEEKRITIYFEGKRVGYYVPDLIINNCVLIELKRKPFLTKQDEQQFWYYLKCAEYKLGFLINFGDQKLEIKRRIFDKARIKFPRLSALLSAPIRLENSGFTVLELMVVIGIFVMMLVLTVPNFKSFDKNQVLESEADKVFSILRQAQIWALTGQTIAGTRYNYGIHFNVCVSGATCYYTFFSDNWTTGNKRFDAGEAYNVGQVALSRGLYTSALSPNSNGLDVVFRAPDGQVYFNGVEGSEISAQITLSSSLTGRTRSITINGKSGQINIQ
jgi:GxxExxY protein